MNAGQGVLAMLNLEAATALLGPSQWVKLYVHNSGSFAKNMCATLLRNLIGIFKKIMR
jgi:hypothetical protein